MKENKFHSIPYRFPNSLMIHNRHPWCHSPCRKGSYSRPPRRHHSSSSRLPTSRSHRKLVPGQYCRGSGIHRTSTPGCSGHNNLPVKVKSLSFGKRQHLLCSSYWHRYLQISWTEFFYASFEKQELKVCDYLQRHVWPRGGEFHWRYSDPYGLLSLSCLFPLHQVPALKSAAEASAEVGFWWVHHLKDFPTTTDLDSLQMWSGYW